MPANLNALIRYKTINNCLYGGIRRWSIDELIRACSNALIDSRGRMASVSERTVRDDLRVMKSDILGYNAPIAQKDGFYYYSDPHYSIMSINITDSGLASQIISLLTELKTKVSHPELETILEKLMGLKGIIGEKDLHGDIIIEKSAKPAYKRTALPKQPKLKKPLKDIWQTFYQYNKVQGPATEFQSVIQSLPEPSTGTTWGDIFKLIS